MSQPSWRKPAGIFLILLIILLWAIIVASASAWVGGLPVLIQGLFISSPGSSGFFR
jgi:hypothetical protein